MEGEKTGVDKPDCTAGGGGVSGMEERELLLLWLTLPPPSSFCSEAMRPRARMALPVFCEGDKERNHLKAMHNVCVLVIRIYSHVHEQRQLVALTKVLSKVDRLLIEYTDSD